MGLPVQSFADENDQTNLEIGPAVIVDDSLRNRRPLTTDRPRSRDRDRARSVHRSSLQSTISSSRYRRSADILLAHGTSRAQIDAAMFNRRAQTTDQARPHARAIPQARSIDRPPGIRSSIGDPAALSGDEGLTLTEFLSETSRAADRRNELESHERASIEPADRRASGDGASVSDGTGVIEGPVLGDDRRRRLVLGIREPSATQGALQSEDGWTQRWYNQRFGERSMQQTSRTRRPLTTDDLLTKIAQCRRALDGLELRFAPPQIVGTRILSARTSSNSSRETPRASSRTGNEIAVSTSADAPSVTGNAPGNGRHGQRDMTADEYASFQHHLCGILGVFERNHSSRSEIMARMDVLDSANNDDPQASDAGRYARRLHHFYEMSSLHHHYMSFFHYLVRLRSIFFPIDTASPPIWRLSSDQLRYLPVYVGLQTRARLNELARTVESVSPRGEMHFVLGMIRRAQMSRNLARMSAPQGSDRAISDWNGESQPIAPLESHEAATVNEHASQRQDRAAAEMDRPAAPDASRNPFDRAWMRLDRGSSSGEERHILQMDLQRQYDRMLLNEARPGGWTLPSAPPPPSPPDEPLQCLAEAAPGRHDTVNLMGQFPLSNSIMTRVQALSVPERNAEVTASGEGDVSVQTENHLPGYSVPSNDPEGRSARRSARETENSPAVTTSEDIREADMRVAGELATLLRGQPDMQRAYRRYLMNLETSGEVLSEWADVSIADPHPDPDSAEAGTTATGSAPVVRTAQSSWHDADGSQIGSFWANFRSSR
ncbi:MAG: hypothetical protein M1825_005925 [Sarcosagium campestre]|nr:MAG: hypothetical protein M1825_005925 [Sarcosagium campestre]